MSPGERERIIEGLIGRLSEQAEMFEQEGLPAFGAKYRMEVRALEDMRPFWTGGPDHLVGKQIKTAEEAG